MILSDWIPFVEKSVITHKEGIINTGTSRCLSSSMCYCCATFKSFLVKIFVSILGHTERYTICFSSIYQYFWLQFIHFYILFWILEKVFWKFKFWEKKKIKSYTCFFFFSVLKTDKNFSYWNGKWRETEAENIYR